VTQNFGAQTRLDQTAPKIVGADTVMRMLERNATVTTRYGGGFVESIDGHSGGSEDGQPDDWFYYVNGVEAGKGAAGDQAPQRRSRLVGPPRSGRATESIPAVVGSFPEPFLDGYGGKQYPTRVECTQTARRPAPASINALATYGIPAGSAASTAPSTTSRCACSSGPTRR
jgi:hypothetical protein